MTGYGLPPVGGIVVGVSEGSAARGAVGWAARAARARQLPLVVCHAYQSTDTRTDNELQCAARNRAWRMARECVRLAQAEAPGVRAVPWVGEGQVPEVLVGAVLDPEFLVVGVRSGGRRAAELVASFDHWAGGFGPCPVVAVPSRRGGLARLARRRRRGPRRGAAGRVVVAAEGGHSHEDVRRFALAEAALWGGQVREVPMSAFRVPDSNAYESLSAAAHDADLLVVGRPAGGGAVAARPMPVAAPADTAENLLQAPSVASLRMVLGSDLLRSLGTPVAVVPVTERSLAGGPRITRQRDAGPDKRGGRGLMTAHATVKGAG